MMVSFVLSFFPRDVLDEILNLIGSVSEGFPSYSYIGSFTSVVKISKFKSFKFKYHVFAFPRTIMLHVLRMGLRRGAGQNIIAIIF